MFMIGTTYVFIAGTMWLMLIPDPKDIGIEMANEEAEWFVTSRGEGEVRQQGYQPV